MSVTLYDEAIIKKINSWVGDSRLKVMSYDDFNSSIAVTADETGDKPIELPLILITRSGFTIANTGRTQKSSYGLTIEANLNKNEWINAIPIDLSYQVDIYTRYMKEANEYVRNMIFNIVNFPRLTIELPYYDEKLTHNSSLSLKPEVEDNSSIPQRLIPGQFTRLTLDIDVNDAYIFDLRVGDNKNIEYNIYLDEIQSKGLIYNGLTSSY